MINKHIQLYSTQIKEDGVVWLPYLGVCVIYGGINSISLNQLELRVYGRTGREGWPLLTVETSGEWGLKEDK